MQPIAIGDWRIQRRIEIEFIEAHDVHVDIRIPCAVWHIDAIEYVDPAAFAERVMRNRIVPLIFAERGFIRKKAKIFPANLHVPESQPAAVAAIALRRALVEIDASLELHELAMATSEVRAQHGVLRG
ncbi:hypothetical protein HDG33_003186 [Paraburkholderia sp. Cpub6]|nr:hypothetical protein [Paraburkholderia sp. Cpub6]